MSIALRETKSRAADPELTDPRLRDAGLSDAILAHPILVGRRIVRRTNDLRLCPSGEVVLDLSDRLPPPVCERRRQAADRY